MIEYNIGIPAELDGLTKQIVVVTKQTTAAKVAENWFDIIGRAALKRLIFIREIDFSLNTRCPSRTIVG